MTCFGKPWAPEHDKGKEKEVKHRVLLIRTHGRRKEKENPRADGGIQDKQDSQPCLDKHASELAACPSRISKHIKGKRWLQATKTFSTQKTTDVKGRVPCLLKKKKTKTKIPC